MKVCKSNDQACPLSAVNENEYWCHECGAIISRPLNQIVTPDNHNNYQGRDGELLICKIVDASQPWIEDDVD